MNPIDPPGGRALSDEQIAEIRAAHDGCIASGDDLCDVPRLLGHIDALTAECEGRGRELEAARECHVEQRRRADNLAVIAAEVRTLMHEMEAERDAAREALASSRSREAELRTLLIEGGYCRVCAMHEDDGHEAWCDVAQEALAASRNREKAWRDAVQAFAEAQTLPCESAEQLDEKSRAIGRSGHALRVLLAAARPDEVTGEGGAG